MLELIYGPNHSMGRSKGECYIMISMGCGLVNLGKYGLVLRYCFLRNRYDAYQVKLR